MQVRMRVTTLITMLALGACNDASVRAQAPPPDAVLATVLRVMADSSEFAAGMKVDPRLLAADAPPEARALVALAPEQLARNRAVIRAAGFEEGDYLLAEECDPAGRLTVTKGRDTLMRPGRPPVPPELLARCAEIGNALVLILHAPTRHGAEWRVHTSLAGDGATEVWEIVVDGQGRLRTARRIVSART